MLHAAGIQAVPGSEEGSAWLQHNAADALWACASLNYTTQLRVHPAPCLLSVTAFLWLQNSLIQLSDHHHHHHYNNVNGMIVNL